MSIIKLQASRECEYVEACKDAAALIDSNSELFNNMVQAEITKHDRSTMLTRINKARSTWIQKGYEKGVQDCQITYPCAVCGESLVMKKNGAAHQAMKAVMKQKGWAHVKVLTQY